MICSFFRKAGTFDSLIAGTQCNPSEVDVQGGTFSLADDDKTLTFVVPGFSYTGTLKSVSDSKLVILFDLGPGFSIEDTFSIAP
jgi:hypothetical protein